jgi:hypothetical protein
MFLFCTSRNLIYFLFSKQFDGTDYDYTNNDERNSERRNQFDQRHHQINYNNSGGASRRLRLVWDERGKSLEYSLRVDSARRGFWISSVQQKGEGEKLREFHVSEY